MRLEQIIYLTETINTGSMNQAAKNLFTTAQNISKSIKDLEKELGVPLLNRGKYGVTPTGDGKIVYEKATQIRKNIEDIQNIYSISSISALSQKEYHTVHVGTTSSMTIPLQHLTKTFSKDSPSVTLSLYEYEGNNLNKLVLSNAPEIQNYDMLFLASGEKSLEKYLPLSGKYELFVLGSSRLGISLNKDNPYTKNESLPLRTLHNIPLASFQASVDEPSLFFQILNENDFQTIHKPVYVSNSHLVCNNYVSQNPMIGVLCCLPDKEIKPDEYMLPNDTERIVLPLSSDIRILHLMAYPKKEGLSPEVTFFKKQVLTFFKDSYYRYL